MFTEARSFNQPLNNWNVSKVTDMERMFRGATSFDQPLNNWKAAWSTTSTQNHHLCGRAHHRRHHRKTKLIH